MSQGRQRAFKVPLRLSDLSSAAAIVIVLVASILLLPARAAEAWGPGPPPCNPGDRWKDPSDGKTKECNARREWVDTGLDYPEPNEGEICLQEGQEFFKANGSTMICELTGTGLRWILREPPNVSPTPKTQFTDSACWAVWSVTVARSSTVTLTLRVYYGNGASETRTVAPGSGYQSFSFSHYFPRSWDGIRYVQRFQIVDTGQYDETSTVHL